MLDNNVPENHPYEEFAKVAGWTLLGAYIGHKIDQTRFGIWFNNNRIVNLAFSVGKCVLALALVFCVCDFLYFLITEPK